MDVMTRATTIPPMSRLLPLLALAVSCLPPFNNPFDPENGDGGPAIVAAEQRSSAGVRLTLRPVSHPSLTGLRVERRFVPTGGEPGEAVTRDVAATATAFDDTITDARLDGLFRYTVRGVAGDAVSEASAAVDVTLVGPVLTGVAAQHTGIGEATISWDPLPVWSGGVSLTRTCDDTGCVDTPAGEADRSQTSFVDGLEEGRTYVWIVTLLDADGSPLVNASTEDVYVSTAPPYLDDVFRPMHAASTMTLAFSAVPGAVTYQAILREVGGASQQVADATPPTVSFAALSVNADYEVAFTASSAANRKTRESDPFPIPARYWRVLDERRGLEEAPVGEVVLAGLDDAGGRAQLVKVALDQSMNVVTAGFTDLDERGGFTNVSISVGAGQLAWPLVYLPAPARLFSPTTNTLLHLRSPGSLTRVTAGGSPPALNGTPAATVDASGTLWLHVGVPDSKLYRGVFGPGGATIQWTQHGSAPAFLSSRHAMTFHGDELFLIGGVRPVQTTTGFVAFDPSTGATRDVSAPGVDDPEAVLDGALVSDGVSLYVAGGTGVDEPIGVEGAVHRFDPSGGAWSVIAASSGPTLAGVRRALVPHTFQTGRGFFLADRDGLHEFAPLEAAGTFARHALVAPPRSDARARGWAFDGANNRLYVLVEAALYEYEQYRDAGWRIVANESRTGPLADQVAMAWDDASKMVIATGGDGAIWALDPSVDAPAWTRRFVGVGLPSGLVPLAAFVSPSDVGPTFWLAGRVGFAPGVWAVPLSGNAPWASQVTSEVPPFGVTSGCGAPPVACVSLRTPSFHFAGNITGKQALASFDLNRAPNERTFTPFDEQLTLPGCTTFTHLACESSGGDDDAVDALFAIASNGNTPHLARYDLKAKTWFALPNDVSGRRYPSPRPNGVLVKPQTWPRVVLVGGAVSEEATGVWALEVR